MKRLILALCLLAAPLAAQPSRYSLATAIQPGFASTALGDTYYATGSTGSASAFGRLAGNITTTMKFKCQVGTGAVSAATAWCLLSSGDIPSLDVAKITTGVFPIVRGGTGTASTLVGLVRGSASAMTAAELSGDGTTSGSNVLTITKLNGTSLAGLVTGILKNTTGTGVPSIAAAGDFPTLNQSTTGSAATLTTARAINGVDFNGSAPITVTADANTLTNTTLKNTVVNSSLTSVGTSLRALWPGASPSSISWDFFGTGMTAGNYAGGMQYDGRELSIFSGSTDASAHILFFTGQSAFNERMRISSDGAVTIPGVATLGGLTVTAAPTFSALTAGYLPKAGTAGLMGNSPVYTDGTNVSIGDPSFGASAVGVLGIGNGTAPSTSPADMVQLWAEDVSASSELRVRDEAGNVTTLSPHNFSLFTPAATQAFPWSYYSKNAHIGKEINVDMYGLAAEVEKLSGKKFIYLADLPAGEIEDWTAQEATKKVTIEKQRLDKATAVEIEVVARDAAESVAIMETQESKTLTETVTTYCLDAASGTVKPVVSTKPKSEQVATGETEFRLKAGVRLDEKTGRFWRKTKESEAVVEPYVPKEPPTWIKDRMKVAVTP